MTSCHSRFTPKEKFPIALERHLDVSCGGSGPYREYKDPLKVAAIEAPIVKCLATIHSADRAPTSFNGSYNNNNVGRPLLN